MTALAPRFWIVGSTAAFRFATVALAHRAGHVACIGVSAGRWKRRGSAVIVFSDVGVPVRRGLVVGSMFVRRGVMFLVSVVSVPFRGREVAPVGRGSMRECLVMLLCRFVGPPVIKCCHVGIIGALSGATVDNVLRLVGLL